MTRTNWPKRGLAAGAARVPHTLDPAIGQGGPEKPPLHVVGMFRPWTTKRRKEVISADEELDRKSMLTAEHVGCEGNQPITDSQEAVSLDRLRRLSASWSGWWGYRARRTTRLQVMFSLTW